MKNIPRTGADSGPGGFLNRLEAARAGQGFGVGPREGPDAGLDSSRAPRSAGGERSSGLGRRVHRRGFGERNVVPAAVRNWRELLVTPSPVKLERNTQCARRTFWLVGERFSLAQGSGRVGGHWFLQYMAKDFAPPVQGVFVGLRLTAPAFGIPGSGAPRGSLREVGSACADSRMRTEQAREPEGRGASQPTPGRLLKSGCHFRFPPSLALFGVDRLKTAPSHPDPEPTDAPLRSSVAKLHHEDVITQRPGVPPKLIS